MAAATVLPPVDKNAPTTTTLTVFAHQSNTETATKTKEDLPQIVIEQLQQGQLERKGNVF